MVQKVRKKVTFFTVLGLILLGISLLAPYIVKNDPYETNAFYMKAVPNLQFPFGTDKLGRCIFSRVLVGARMSIFPSLLLVLITMAAGILLGMLAGYYGGVLDQIIMRLVDIILAFPQMVLAIAVAGVLGGSMINAMIALGLTGWTLFARLARGQVMALKHEEFIHAARLSGNSNLRIMFVHILPNIAGEMIVNASIQIGSTMIGIAGLSYLGLGVQVPEAEWGSMINEAKGYMQQAPWAVLAPGIALFITVVIFNLLGDALSEYIGIRSTNDE
ncbi:ABC transporter permease [Anaerosacchariphilus polymeriproducens]|uniref:ABC transporter permease n=1 Tax=Anaerosacchariphilus polymeriproducens TaxID=1812858 RepID=A0A371AZF3_9FIRM|nr:ABC transporter permease [Anaerosacchariphilus polymeriproducens]RDU24936.1 ABC transporter permease [Anaerosacchariphilus polymeriproducens]